MNRIYQVMVFPKKKKSWFFYSGKSLETFTGRKVKIPLSILRWQSFFSFFRWFFFFLCTPFLFSFLLTFYRFIGSKARSFRVMFSLPNGSWLFFCWVARICLPLISTISLLPSFPLFIQSFHVSQVQIKFNFLFFRTWPLITQSYVTVVGCRPC